MTREEAIAALKARCHYCEHFPTCVHDKPECFHAAEMAIKSLEAWDAMLHEIGSLGLDWEYGRGVWDCYNIIKKHLEEVEE